MLACNVQEMFGDSKEDGIKNVTPTDTEIKTKQKKVNYNKIMEGALFQVHGDDFEKNWNIYGRKSMLFLSKSEMIVDIKMSLWCVL